VREWLARQAAQQHQPQPEGFCCNAVLAMITCSPERAAALACVRAARALPPHVNSCGSGVRRRVM
jgi:hypothetical protein